MLATCSVVGEKRFLSCSTSGLLVTRPESNEALSGVGTARNAGLLQMTPGPLREISLTCSPPGIRIGGLRRKYPDGMGSSISI